MDWKNYIHSDPDDFTGKPIIKGTRLAVDHILALLAQGWSEQQLYENYPALSPLVLQAIYAFAAQCVQEEVLYSGFWDYPTYH